MQMVIYKVCDRCKWKNRADNRKCFNCGAALSRKKVPVDNKNQWSFNDLQRLKDIRNAKKRFMNRRNH